MHRATTHCGRFAVATVAAIIVTGCAAAGPTQPPAATTPTALVTVGASAEPSGRTAVPSLTNVTPVATLAASATPRPTPTPLPAPTARPAMASFPVKTSTLRFTSDEGKAVVIQLRDGSGKLVTAVKGTPFGSGVQAPGGDAYLLNDPNQAALRVEWLSPGGCQPSYTITIEPRPATGRWRFWIDSATPLGSDSLGGNCDVTLTFSVPAPAADMDPIVGFAP